MQNAKKRISDISGEVSGEIRLQIFCNRRIVADAIKKFKKRYPKVSFKLNHGFSSGEVFDLIISDDIFQGEYLGKTPLVTEDIAIAFSREHPLAKRKSILINDLVKEQFITMHKNNRLTHLTQELCRTAGFIPEISIECDDPYYMRRYIEMGIGVGFVPMFSWKGQFSEDVICRKLDGCKRTTYVFWDEERYMSAAVREFLNFLCQSAAV